MDITVGARSSRLSKEQVFEVWKEISAFHPSLRFHPLWTITGGDRDRTTPLWKVTKTDFFSQEIDEMLLRGEVRIAIHSAKDLPSPLPKGLCVIALTQGVDPRDSLVMRGNTTLETLPANARVGTSSKRREEALKKLRADLQAVDIRGTIDERLEQLQNGAVDAILVAEAALIRLKLTDLNRCLLDHDTEPLQGRLAVVARSDDSSMPLLFAPIDSRKHVAVVGPSVPQSLLSDPFLAVIHSSLISLERLPASVEQLRPIKMANGVILTSKHAAIFLHEALHTAQLSVTNCRFFCVGNETAVSAQTLFPSSQILTAGHATQEGVVSLILSEHPQHLFWPRSTHARRHLSEALEQAGIFLTELPLYTPVAASTPCSLEGIDSVYFTCPSSVDAFFDIMPKGSWESLFLQAIGPVTQARLRKRLSSSA